MIERGPATEANMIATFLQAEADPNSHWSDCVNAGLAVIRAERSLIESPNLDDPAENRSRKDLLFSYRRGQFVGFPEDTTWRTVDLQPEDFRAIFYMDHANWNEFSGQTRLVCEGARNLLKFASDGRFQHIFAICQAIRAGTPLLPLIAAQRDGARLVLIEGHSRATAYAAVGFGGPVRALVGSSSSMNEWIHYRFESS